MDIDDVITTFLATVAFGAICISFGIIVHNSFPHGDIVERTGIIIDVDYDAGGYGVSSQTFVRWEDGSMINLLGTSNNLKCNIPCTLTYQDGDWYKYFISIEYHEE